MIRHIQAVLTSFCFEDQLRNLLVSLPAVIHGLKTDMLNLEARNKRLMEEMEQLRLSNRQMKCQQDNVRTSLINELTAKRELRKERDS